MNKGTENSETRN